MRQIQLAVAMAILALVGMTLDAAQDQNASMSFFVTREGAGNGANLGGLDGADRYCQKLAAAAGAGSRTWRAYLSASAMDGKPAVNARDRIGAGPWHNAKGVKIADNVADLHSDHNNLKRETALDEKGNRVNGRGDTPNKHDILTGSQPDGTAYAAGADLTCRNWTAGNAGKLAGKAQVGHHDREGLSPGVSSWNSAHASRGCGQEDLKSSGGAGLLYCFAAK
ncbi:MAG: lectin [Deltaproteobacteria bacterium]|nr:lectin [Deltaproteobacteria bacterium]MBI2210902.1 lectin [Deltaproteobacteria bacterium]MBI2540852.1 lectin [Deltaproteobacteria bacterium]